MVNPITHALWGYVISGHLTNKKDFILLGIFMAILMDIDGAPIPGFPHRGFIHTPIFILALCGAVYWQTRSETLFTLCYINLLGHLILDTIGSNWKVVWLYPLTSEGVVLGTTFPRMLFLKAIYLIIPILLIFKEYRDNHTNPLELLDHMKVRFGENTTFALIFLFFSGTFIYYSWSFIEKLPIPYIGRI